MAERGSIGQTTMRLLRIDSFVTCAARGEGGGDLLAVAVMEIQADVARRVVVQQRRIRRCRGAARW